MTTKYIQDAMQLLKLQEYPPNAHADCFLCYDLFRFTLQDTHIVGANRLIFGSSWSSNMKYAMNLVRVDVCNNFVDAFLENWKPNKSEKIEHNEKKHIKDYFECLPQHIEKTMPWATGQNHHHHHFYKLKFWIFNLLLSYV